MWCNDPWPLCATSLSTLLAHKWPGCANTIILQCLWITCEDMLTALHPRTTPHRRRLHPGQPARKFKFKWHLHLSSTALDANRPSAAAAGATAGAAAAAATAASLSVFSLAATRSFKSAVESCLATFHRCFTPLAHQQNQHNSTLSSRLLRRSAAWRSILFFFMASPTGCSDLGKQICAWQSMPGAKSSAAPSNLWARLPTRPTLMEIWHPVRPPFG